MREFSGGGGTDFSAALMRLKSFSFYYEKLLME
jgi:hypothetical protein